MAFSKPFKYEDLLKEYKKLKTKSDRYDALVAAAAGLIQTIKDDFHINKFEPNDIIEAEIPANLVQQLARLLGDE